MEKNEIDYRGDCWRGFKDVRARLGNMARGHEFQFICAADMAGKMDRVISINGGVVRSKEQRPDGTVIQVMKAE